MSQTDFCLRELSEVSCENCTHTAIVAQKFGYVQRDIGGIGLHHESQWDCDGINIGCHVIAMGLNLGGIAMRSNSGGITKEFMRMKIPL